MPQGWIDEIEDGQGVLTDAGRDAVITVLFEEVELLSGEILCQLQELKAEFNRMQGGK